MSKLNYRRPICLPSLSLSLSLFSFCSKQRLPITTKTLYRKFETNIPRKGIARPQSQFLHSCVCERFIYSHRSAYSVAGKYVDRSWEYINHSQKHECLNLEIWTAQFLFWEYINRIFMAVIRADGRMRWSYKLGRQKKSRAST